tara:strand:- start:2284 stop:2859 length:576 start_codon:yes stop_codon:yes gene_type:complete
MKKSIFVDKLPGFGDLEPNMYLLHSEGGPHYFSQCTINVEPIYKKNIWPYVERVKGHPMLKSLGKKPGIMLGSIGKTKLDYITHNLYKKSKFSWKRTDSRVLKNKEKKTYLRIKPRHYSAQMHRLVALAFIENNDPLNKVLVDHINRNKLDYRVKNLRWFTPRENSKGTIGGKNDPNEIYNLVSQQDWFKI